MKMKQGILRYSVALLILCASGFGPTLPGLPSSGSEAFAVIGRPLTPISVAGVARRTTRRAVVYGSSAAAYSASASQQQAAAAQADAAAAQQQAAAAQADAAAAQEQVAQIQQAAKLPAGTVVTALPTGCTTVSIGGADYFNCAGNYYKAAFQSNQVVYVVTEP